MSFRAITPSEEAPIAQLSRSLVISLIAFLTLVDLFATQAILPSLAAHYGVGPAEMSVAVNASTLGMAIAGLGVSLFAGRIDRRLGILFSLALLSIPTALLASLPDLQSFALLRIVQGLCMASAFSLTLAYLAEQCSAKAAAGAFAAYVTGNVASNLFGRILSAGVADHYGLAWNFYLFAGLNLAGALLAWAALRATKPMDMDRVTPFRAWLEHLKTPALAASFAVGFCILFAFIGAFSFINFVLVKAPYDLSPMSLGLVYFVFLPSIFTTPLAGRAAQRFGFRQSVIAALLLALFALPLLMMGSLVLLLIGLALIAVGTFFAQALATGFVGRRASSNRAAASGLYLASYFFGGLVGSALLGEIFVTLGWPATLIGIAGALTLALLLSPFLRLKAQSAVFESAR